jgi:hypothetical protein
MVCWLCINWGVGSHLTWPLQLCAIRRLPTGLMRGPSLMAASNPCQLGVTAS